MDCGTREEGREAHIEIRLRGSSGPGEECVRCRLMRVELGRRYLLLRQWVSGLFFVQLIWFRGVNLMQIIGKRTVTNIPSSFACNCSSPGRTEGPKAIYKNARRSTVAIVSEHGAICNRTSKKASPGDLLPRTPALILSHTECQIR